MSEGTEQRGVEGARQAASRGDWSRAFGLLAEADAASGLGPQDLLLLAETAYAAGELEAMFEALEKAHAASVRAGDKVSAAAAATRIAMHMIIDTGLLAPVRRWLKRAEQLLEDAGTTPVHALLGLARAYERFFSGDFVAARRLSQEAIDVGTEQGEHSAATMARICHARCHIFEGDVDEGLRLLDEAAALLHTVDIDPLTKGMIYCEIVCAWQGVAMYDLAERWTEEMERFRDRHAIGSVSGRCRIHRAEILRLRGACRDAEGEALAACEELGPYMRREFGWPLTELGTIRLRMGDLDGAEEAFLSAHERGWEPQPGLALLRLAQGDVAAASSLIRDALERPLGLMSKEMPPNNELCRSPLLEAQVEIAVAEGDLDRARLASEELSRIAENFKSNALSAASALAVGRLRLAEGELSEAIHAFRTAVHLWSEIAAPYELALARMGLGHAYRARGFEEGAALEFRAANLAFVKVGATDQAEAASAALQEVEPARPAAPDPADTEAGGTNRFRLDGDYWRITFDNETILVRDMKGLRYLERLLSEAGRELHVVDLVALERGAPAEAASFAEPGLSSSTGGDAGEMLDDRAKDAYRRRLVEIDEDIEEARTFGDAERASRSTSEREFLLRELSRAVGMDGRDRRAGATSERARASVTRAIRSALKKIGDHHRALGAHLDLTVRTGTYCSYMPDPRVDVDWTLER